MSKYLFIRPEFAECSDCAKNGRPALCVDCLERRELHRFFADTLAGKRYLNRKKRVIAKTRKLLAPAVPECSCDELTKSWRWEDRAALCGHVVGCPMYPFLD